MMRPAFSAISMPGTSFAPAGAGLFFQNFPCKILLLLSQFSISPDFLFFQASSIIISLQHAKTGGSNFYSRFLSLPPVSIEYGQQEGAVTQ